MTVYSRSFVWKFGIKAPEPEWPGLWSLFGCAEFEASGLNPKYEIQLHAEKVEEGWKFWFPEAVIDCVHCPVRPCRFIANESPANPGVGGKVANRDV